MNMIIERTPLVDINKITPMKPVRIEEPSNVQLVHKFLDKVINSPEITKILVEGTKPTPLDTITTEKKYDGEITWTRQYIELKPLFEYPLEDSGFHDPSPFGQYFKDMLTAAFAGNSEDITSLETHLKDAIHLGPFFLNGKNQGKRVYTAGFALQALGKALKEKIGREDLGNLMLGLGNILTKGSTEYGKLSSANKEWNERKNGKEYKHVPFRNETARLQFIEECKEELAKKLKPALEDITRNIPKLDVKGSDYMGSLQVLVDLSPAPKSDVLPLHPEPFQKEQLDEEYPSVAWHKKPELEIEKENNKLPKMKMQNTLRAR